MIVELGGVEIRAERRGVDGDLAAFNRLMRELDGNVDVLSVGGTEIAFHVDGETLRFRSTDKLIDGVTKTPLVDGAGVKMTLERRVFDLVSHDQAMDDSPRFEQAFLNIALDRWGMALAVGEVSDAVVYGDLMFSFGVPVALHSLGQVKRMAHVLVPIAGRLPLRWLYPSGENQTVRDPKFAKHFEQSDLICGDFLYIAKYAPDDLSGKTVLTNTTTEENVEWLSGTGATRPDHHDTSVRRPEFRHEPHRGADHGRGRRRPPADGRGDEHSDRRSRHPPERHHLLTQRSTGYHPFARHFR